MGWVMHWINAPGALKRLKESRAALLDVTPMKGDCGKLCNHACCQPDETGENGMLLYPYEEQLYRKPIEGFPFRLEPDDRLHKGGMRLICEGRCPREHRPLACRIFPLRMRVTDVEGHTQVTAELDPRAWAVCPLPEEGGLRAMRQDFVAAVEQAGKRMCESTVLLMALLKEQQELDDTRKL